jgi:DNA-binding GntR family transcriptional regulator
MIAPTSPLELRSLSVRAREPILDMVIDGDIELDQLCSTDVVATQLKISRTPLREALMTFETMGIATVYPKRGFTVNSVPPASMAEWMCIGRYADSQALKRLNRGSPNQNVSRVLAGMLMLQTE